MPTHDCWTVTDAVMGVSRRVLLHGPPGTGKTYAATRRALPEDKKVYSITLTEETPMAEIRGHFVQKDGSFVWMDGPAVLSWKEDARLVLNEIDKASEDVLTFLYAIMDDPEFAFVDLPTGERISPSEGFQLVATMNGEPEDLPDALQDRLPVAIEITDLNPEALERLPEDLRGPAKNTTLLENNERRLSIRAWLEFASLREKLGDSMGEEGLLLAAEAVFGDRGTDALLALNVATEASPEFAMSAGPATDKDAYDTIRTLIVERMKATGSSKVDSTDSGGKTQVWRATADDISNSVKIAYGFDMQVRVTDSGFDEKPAFRWDNQPDEYGNPQWVFADGSTV